MRQKYYFLALCVLLAATSAVAFSLLPSTITLNVVVFKADELPVAPPADFACDSYAYASGKGYRQLTSGVYTSGGSRYGVYKSCYLTLIKTDTLHSGGTIGFFRAALAPETVLVATMPPADFNVLKAGEYTLKSGRKIQITAQQTFVGAIPR